VGAAAVNSEAAAASAPLVSVIIPTFNRAGVLYYALHSILNQTLQDFEVFVVDDASTDATPELIEYFNDPRIHYIRFSTNKKAAAARNAGMQRARGKYIAFLDSDDEWLPSKLEKQVACLEALSDEWGCCYTGAFVNKVGGLTRHRIYRPRKSGDLVRDLLMGNFVIWTPTFMFRRSCLDEIGLMDERLVRSQDVDFYIRLLSRYKIASISEPLANIFLVLNKNLARVAAESRAILLAKHGELIDSLGFFSSRYVYSMSDMIQAEAFMSDGDMGSAFRSFRRAVARNPFMPVRRYAAFSKRVVSALLGSGEGGAAPQDKVS
jgi:glycosyltransferase involved in cell wall biosynthesis